MNNDDLISRQAAIDELKEHRALYCDNTPDTFSILFYAEKIRVDELDTAIATLVNLPSAQPEIEPKTGHWIDYYGEVEIYNAGGFTERRKIGVKCSACQWINRWHAGNYCGNCGAKMKGE